ncbi:MAG: polyprenyl synthetase family protein [Paracoccaceae bacterium]
MFRARLDDVAAQVQAHLDDVMAPLEGPVAPAMRYTCQGGKRLRAFLVMEGARLHGVPPAQAIWPAAAIEMVHAYSLVHDDLPCMDDDDLRRGRPTVHIKWDEGTAVLAGDALQTLAFECLARPECHRDPAVRADLVLTMAQAAGAQGMVLGQALDIAAETAATPLTLDQIIALQDGKTGALIQWSATAGPLMARADTAPLRHYAQALGLAFQIADDILDVTGNEDIAGKRLQKDADAGKATFVSLLGLAGAQQRASDLIDRAIEALSVYGPEADSLRDAARFVIARDS